MSRTDYQILAALEDSGKLPAQKPSVIAFNLGLSREHVSRRLSEFVERGLVERVESDAGYYRITEAGRQKINVA